MGFINMLYSSLSCISPYLSPLCPHLSHSLSQSVSLSLSCHVFKWLCEVTVIFIFIVFFVFMLPLALLCLCSSANNSLRCILIICVVHTYLLHCQLWRHRLLLFAFVFLMQPLCFRKCIVINMGGAELSQKQITHVKCESHRFINTSEEHFFLKD